MSRPFRPFLLSALLIASTITPCVSAADLAELCAKFEKPGATLQQKVWLVSQIAEEGNDEARNYLIERFFEETDKKLRRTIFDALAIQLPPLTRRITRQTSVDADPYLRSETLEQLRIADPTKAGERARQVLLFDEDPRVRRTAVRCLVSLGDEPAARFVLDTCAGLSWIDQRAAIAELTELTDSVFRAVLSDEENWKPGADPSRRLLATLILAAKGDAADSKRLKTLSKDKDPLIKFAASLGLDRAAGKGKATQMKRAFGRAKKVDDRCALLNVARRAGIGDVGLTGLLSDDLGHRDWRVRACAADALAESDPAGALGELTDLLEKERIWQVRIAAVRALGYTQSAEAIPILIGLMDASSGRERYSLRQALSRLAGVDMGMTTTGWARWWDGEKDGFQPPPVDVARFDDLAQEGDKYAFYGLEVTSDRVAFVLDRSGSMGGKRIATMKEQLERIVTRLPESTYFNMIFFHSGTDSWQEELKPLTDANRNSALAALRYLEANGGTNFWGGVTTAFEDEQVDTIYILSDGEPTAGEIKSIPTICRKVTEMNQHRRVAIHIVMIGYESQELRRLAVESGGTYAVYK